MKLSDFLTVTFSISAFLVVSMMDLSSLCHPSDEAQAMQDHIRSVSYTHLTLPTMELV